MQINVNREILQFWASMAAKILPSGDLPQPLDKAVVLSAKDGVLSIQSNSGFYSLRIANILCEGELETVAVEAKSLSFACSGAGEFVELTLLMDKGQLHVETPGSKVDLDLIHANGFEMPDKEAFEDHGAVPKQDFMKVLERTLPFLSGDSARPFLMGTMFKGNRVYASDTMQGARFTWDNVNFLDDINFVPNGMVDVLKTAGEDASPVTIKSNSRWVCAHVGDIEVCSRRWAVRGEYKTEALDNEILAGSRHTTHVVINTASLANGLSQIAYFIDKGCVRIVVSRNGCKLQAFNSRGVVATRDLLAETDKDADVKLILEVGHLKALLKTGQDEIDLRIGEAGDTIYTAIDNMEYFVNPMTE